MWLLTSWPAAKADMRESSPARTAPATILAKHWAFAPADSAFAPFTPSRFKQAACEANWVPPPTVPTCTEGMVTDTCRSFPSLAASIMVMH
eukprot:Gb_26606 [translate_table: standard]